MLASFDGMDSEALMLQRRATVEALGPVVPDQLRRRASPGMRHPPPGGHCEGPALPTVAQAGCVTVSQRRTCGWDLLGQRQLRCRIDDQGVVPVGRQ